MAGLGRVKPLAERRVRPKRYDFCGRCWSWAPEPRACPRPFRRRGAARACSSSTRTIRSGGSLGYARAGTDSSHAVLGELRAAAACSRIWSFAPELARSATMRTTTYRSSTPSRSPSCGPKQSCWRVARRSNPRVSQQRPAGVMLGSAAQRLIYRYAVKPGENALILAANREAYEVALDLARVGVKVTAIVDLRPEGEPSELRLRALNSEPADPERRLHQRSAGRPSCHGCAQSARSTGKGSPKLSRMETIACDAIVVSVGFAPAAALLYQSGARFEHDLTLEQFVPKSLPRGVFAAGRVNGVYDLKSRLSDGQRAGMEAAALLGFAASPPQPSRRAARAASRVTLLPNFRPREGQEFPCISTKIWSFRTLVHAAQEGFDSIELIKRYATVGMGPSQGKHFEHEHRARARQAARALGRLCGHDDGAGRSITPCRCRTSLGAALRRSAVTPLHSRHEHDGAVFFHAGNWLRPAYYAKKGHSQAECVQREVRAVRNGVGLIDVGTLGKLELVRAGRDRACSSAFTRGAFADLLPGKTRYALMLDESGVIIDDGVVARLAEDNFYFTTTTTGSVGVYRELLRWITRFGLNVGLVNVTGSHAAMNLAGPAAASVLGKLTDLDLSPQAFPYIGVRRLGEVAGIPVRLLRVGFVGEFGYELHTLAEHAGALWDALRAAGKDAVLLPCGIDAQRCAAPRERASHRGSGFRRAHHAVRSGARVGGQNGQARFRRSTQLAKHRRAPAQASLGRLRARAKLRGRATEGISSDRSRRGNRRPCHEHRTESEPRPLRWARVRRARPRGRGPAAQNSCRRRKARFRNRRSDAFLRSFG